MKALALVDSPEYLRFFDSAFEELARRGHDVVIAVNGDSGKKPIGLDGLRARGGSVRVLGVVPTSTGLWHGVARGLRGTMDFVRFLHPDFADAPALRARIKRKVLPGAYAWLDKVPRLTPAGVRIAELALAAFEQAIPLRKEAVDYLRAQAPDVLLVSPLVAAASDQVDWIKAARALGVPVAVCIASWDNLTNKGLLRVQPDLVVVWNGAQKREAVEYHYVPERAVAVTGAQLFDKWFVQQPSRDRQAFCARVGLRDTRPFLLFTGSSGFISESGAEVAFVRRWVESLRASGDPLLADANILVRPHPYNCHRWSSDPLADLAGVAVFPRTGYNPIDGDNRADFFDSLSYCEAVVGINTSAMIEAGIVGRPVFSIVTSEFAHTQAGTLHFHHLLPEHGGFVRVTATLDAHVAQLGDSLRDPEPVRAQIRAFVASFIRPHGLDRPATPIFADVVERLGGSRPPRRPLPAWAVALRPLLLVLALPVPLVRVVGGSALPGHARKRAATFRHRGRKMAKKIAAMTRDRLRRTGKRVARSRLRWLARE